MLERTDIVLSVPFQTLPPMQNQSGNSQLQENMFAKTIEGNPLIDKAYEMICAA